MESWLRTMNIYKSWGNRQCRSFFTKIGAKSNIIIFRKSKYNSENEVSEKNVLIVGAGRVASPLVEYLYTDKSIGITVACEQIDLADKLAKVYPGIESTYLNATEGSSVLQVYSLIIKINNNPILFQRNCRILSRKPT